MNEVITGYIKGCRINTSSDFVYIEAGVYEHNNQLININSGKYKFTDFIDKPEPETWYHVYLNKTDLIITKSTNNKIGRRIGSILTAKQKWWEKFINRVHLRILSYTDNWYIITDSSNNIDKWKN